MSFVSIKNNQAVPIIDIPTVSYDTFMGFMRNLLEDQNNHCVTYFGYPVEGSKRIKFIAIIANDNSSELYLLSYELPASETQLLESLTKDIPALHIFEREIHENFGIGFRDHPWLKPVRYAWNRADKSQTLVNYPFYRIEGSESHEVGVGPIHAGVIEPGHFRFSCFGENVHHLEIQLGYQHRGVEALFLNKKTLIQRTVLAESISGDSVVGHTTAFVQTMEQLYGIEASLKLSLLRTIAAEIERISIHVGNISAVCQDIAYQLGSSVLGALRTPMINYSQWWCGNRFSKGLIRVGYNPYPLHKELRERLTKTLNDFEAKYVEMADEMFSLPSVQARLEKTGIVTKEQARMMGLVGLGAKMTGVPRDIRTSHPYAYYKNLFYMPAVMKTGDTMAHAQLRDQEIRKSIRMLRFLLEEFDKFDNEDAETRVDLTKRELKPNTFALSLTEGWRGEICHVAITDEKGELAHYKVKDPSMHNWFGLAIALRDNEISDFPICNKSFDQSYCGFDL